MNWTLFITFCILTVFNVIISTAKSIITIRCNKWIASAVNALSYGLNTIVVVYTVCELDLWLKVAVVAAANLIGVFIVKTCEEKSAKEKLWKVEATVRLNKSGLLEQLLKNDGIAFSVMPVISADKDMQYKLFHIFCHTKDESRTVRTALTMNCIQAKFFVEESKTL